MKIIHCSDLHLESPLSFLSREKAKVRREELILSFEKMCDYALDVGVKAVIVAGDMFDKAKVSLKTMSKVINIIEKHDSIDFLCLSGNHDVGVISGVENLPSNIKIFTENWSQFRYDNVVIGGVQVSSNNSLSFYDQIKFNKEDVNIAVLHGQVAGYVSTEKGENISIPRLKDKYIDYLALGHIHYYSENKLDLRGKYCYSGCLEGRGFDELDKKGFVLIDTDGGKVNTQFVPFSYRIVYEVSYDVTGKTSPIGVYNDVVALVENNCSRNGLVKVIIKGKTPIDFDIDIDGLTAKLSSEYFFAKIYDEHIVDVEKIDLDADKSILGEFIREVNKSDLSQEDKNKVIVCGIKILKGEM